MKTFLSTLLFLSLVVSINESSFAIIYKTVNSGSWNDSIWTPRMPGNMLDYGDSILIHHPVVLNQDVELQGTMRISSKGELIGDEQAIIITKTGELLNFGIVNMFEIVNIGFIKNHGTLNVWVDLNNSYGILDNRGELIIGNNLVNIRGTLSNTSSLEVGSYLNNMGGTTTNDGLIVVLKTFDNKRGIMTGTDGSYIFKEGLKNYGGYIFGKIFVDVYDPEKHEFNFTGTGRVSWERVLFCGDIIPIQMWNFNIRQLSDKVEISWTATEEFNTQHFTIERSTDNINFEVMKEVAGEGDANYMTSYTVTDGAPYPGKNYYRLKQTNKNASFGYFPVKEFEFTGSGEAYLHKQRLNQPFKNEDGRVWVIMESMPNRR